MKNQFTSILILIVCLFISTISMAQVRVIGKVIESNGQQPIEFATIMVGDVNTKKALTGTTTGVDGTFSAKVKSKEIYVEVSFIGYETQTIQNITIQKGIADIGTITLSDNSEKLGEVTVVGEKSTTEFRLDKRVFNVGSDL
ncbi:MAG: carboxypeptidase-like regulatory domain-containing protein, partial [Saprospiraceae bacterium]